MQRKQTRNTRGPTAEEKRFIALVKMRPCCVCGNPGPSIANHAMGATWKHNKVLCGHRFIIPLCQECDDVITHGSRRKFREKFDTQSSLWLKETEKYGDKHTQEVIAAIADWYM